MFQLVFKGECTPGTELDTARDSARALFKASLDQVDRMFSGQPVVIRNKLDEAQAEKYRAVLHKHGMVAYVEPMPGAQPQPAPTSARPAAAAPDQSADQGQRNVQRQEPQQPAAKPVGGVPFQEPGDRLQVAGEKVDTILAGSGLALDPVGVRLAEHHEVEPPMFQHLDDWTLAPAGSELGVKQELPPPMAPDVSHLSLVDDQEDQNDR